MYYFPFTTIAFLEITVNGKSPMTANCTQIVPASAIIGKPFST